MAMSKLITCACPSKPPKGSALGGALDVHDPFISLIQSFIGNHNLLVISLTDELNLVHYNPFCK
ncbi:MAG: hypothetical protein ACI9DO_003481 [Reinekea sp.]|jgi:hypothetical protein